MAWRILDSAGREKRTQVGPGKLVTLAGRVNGDGTIAAGTGFTVNKTGTGQYTVTFSTTLAAVPVILCQLEGAITQQSMQLNMYTPSTTGFIIQTARDSSGTGAGLGFVDYPFHFVAVVI